MSGLVLTKPSPRTGGVADHGGRRLSGEVNGMVRSKRGADLWVSVAVTVVIVSGLVVSCSNNNGTATTPFPAATAPSSDGTGTAPSSNGTVTTPSSDGTGTPRPPETDNPPTEMRVPTDLVDKTLEAAQAQLSAAGIPFTTSFQEAENPQVRQGDQGRTCRWDRTRPGRQRSLASRRGQRKSSTHSCPTRRFKRFGY